MCFLFIQKIDEYSNVIGMRNSSFDDILWILLNVNV